MTGVQTCALPIYPTNDLMGAIHALDRARADITPHDTYERAMRALRLYAANGISSVRTHADTMQQNGLESVRALLAAKRDASSFIDVQVAMLLSWPVNGPEGTANRDLAEKAIAEGIEDPMACNILRDLGCDKGQGYAIARPMPGEEFLDWLLRWELAAAPIDVIQ